VASVGRLYHSNHLDQAWQTLDLCPPELRGWEWWYLQGVRRASGGVPLRHPDPVVAAAVLPDGRLATATRTSGVFIWEGDKHVPLGVPGSALRAHPTRNLLAVHEGKTVRVWDLDDTGEVLETAGDGWVGFTPDGKTLAVAEGPLVRLFETEHWTQVGELVGHQEVVWCGVFSPDGKTLYTGSSDQTVAVWDWPTRVLKARWKRDLAVLALSLTADGNTLFETLPSRLLATDTATGNTRLMSDVSGGRPAFLPTFDPTLFLTTSTSGEVLLRAVEEGEPKRVYRGHTGVILAVAVSPDGKRAVTGGEDGVARVWDLTGSAESSELTTTPYRTAAPVLSPDGRTLALVSRNIHNSREYPLPVLDAASGRELYRTKGTGDASFDPRGRWLAVGRHNATVAVLNPADGSEVRVLDAGTRPPVQVRFSPDGASLAAAELLGIVRVWDTTTWRVTEYTPAEGNRVAGLGWSSDGRLALAEGEDVVLWRPGGGVERRFRPSAHPLVCVFSPDGKALAVAGRGRVLELFDPATGRRTVECIGNPSVVNGLAFNPSGTRLASVGVSGFARVWDTASGKEVLTLRGGADLMGVAWSADGKHLYASGPALRRWSASE
jgi:WD40 repeat protein